jgi:hypothetical protein
MQRVHHQQHAGRLLASGGPFPGDPIGLRVYDGRGERLLRHLFGTGFASPVPGPGSLVHVRAGGSRHVLELPTLRTLGTFPESDVDVHLLGIVSR